MTGLSIDADISAGVNLLGESVTNLQENIEITDRAIIGTLKYVTGYTGFSGAVEEQSGNYLAVHASVPDESDVTITTHVEGSERAPVTLDDDGILVLRVTDAAKTLTFTANKTGFRSVTKRWALNGLTLEEA